MVFIYVIVNLIFFLYFCVCVCARARMFNIKFDKIHSEVLVEENTSRYSQIIYNKTVTKESLNLLE